MEAHAEALFIRTLRPTATTSGGVEADRAVASHRLVECYLDDSYRLAAVILSDVLAAQDAVHDAFVTVWQGLESLREPDRFEAWFGRILVNTCRDRLRRGRRWRPWVSGRGRQPRASIAR